MTTRFLLLALLTMAGCAPVQRGAVFGDAGPDSWVFIDSDDDGTTGVYHCTAGAGRVVCTRAELNR